MVCSCEKGNGGRSIEISGGNGSIGEKGSRKTKENLKRYSEEGFGINRSGRECGIGLRKMEKVHRKSHPCLKGKYGLKTIMIMTTIHDWSQIQIQNDERTKANIAQSSLVVTHPS